MDIIIESAIHQKTFKEYYQNPEFKARHLKYITEKITCNICGVEFSRCNKCKHERSQKHQLREQMHILQEQIKLSNN